MDAKSSCLPTMTTSFSGEHSVIIDITDSGHVKKERLDEDIKEYAETAMKELLGWYGYASSSSSSKDAMRKDSVICRSGTQELDNGEKMDTHMRKSPANTSGSESPRSGHARTTETCGWCGKPNDEHSALTSNSSTFCSELCFSHSRRANFKKNKTCDWCKHVRHTVSYVDFQDGASQLQFCSDKCLNQYKMQIFCRETRAHLKMHPHLAVKDTNSALITPDLWLRNCKSPSSRSSSPVLVVEEPQTSPLPLITVAHPSKLMANPSALLALDKQIAEGVQTRKKRSRKRSSNNKNDVPQDLRIPKNVSCISIPYVDNSASSTPSTVPNGHREFPELTSRLYANANNAEHYFGQLNSNGLASDVLPRPHGPHLPHQGPRFMEMGSLPGNIPAGIPGIPPMPSYCMSVPNLLPPVAVMVPYPVILPLPIPIPIPLPFSAFLQASKLMKPSQNDTSGAAPQNGAENSDRHCDIEERSGENGHSGRKSEDEEEIVVDDVSKEGGETENGERAPLKIVLKRSAKKPECASTSSIQLRKRKREVAVKANGRKMSNNVNYKAKKSVSV